MKTIINCLVISCSFLLIMRNVSDKSCRKNQNTPVMFSNFFVLGNRAVYEVVNTVRCMLIACWIPKTTNTLTICNTYYFSTVAVLARPVGAELFHADRRTDMTKLIVVFRNCGNAPKISPFCPHSVFFFMDLGTSTLFFYAV